MLFNISIFWLLHDDEIELYGLTVVPPDVIALQPVTDDKASDKSDAARLMNWLIANDSNMKYNSIFKIL